MTARVFVIDTNVVVAGLITNSMASPVARVLDAMLAGSLVYVLSPELLTEYRSVLMRPKIIELHGLSETELDRLLIDLTANAMWREPASRKSAPDPNDDHLWTLLDSCPGSTLITGDGLLIENPPETHSVISPRSWVDLFS